MNRYVVEGIAADLAEGKRVVILGNSRSEARRAFLELIELDAPWRHVRRVCGDEEARLGAGWCKVVAAGHRSIRGLSADVAILIGNLEGFSKEAREEIICHLVIAGNTSPGGIELISTD